MTWLKPRCGLSAGYRELSCSIIPARIQVVVLVKKGANCGEFHQLSLTAADHIRRISPPGRHQFRLDPVDGPTDMLMDIHKILVGHNANPFVKARKIYTDLVGIVNIALATKTTGGQIPGFS